MILPAKQRKNGMLLHNLSILYDHRVTEIGRNCRYGLIRPEERKGINIPLPAGNTPSNGAQNTIGFLIRFK